MHKDYVEIKDALPSDASSLAYVGRTTFYESWSDMYTPHDMKIYTDQEFSSDKIEKDLRSDVNTFLIAFMNEKPAGYAKMRRDTTPIEFENSTAIEIERIYALKEYHSRKIGYSLMMHCLEIAHAEKRDWIWLGVNEFNEKAIKFYKHFGFEVFGIKEFKLCDVVDHDLMMRKKLK